MSLNDNMKYVDLIRNTNYIVKKKQNFTNVIEIVKTTVLLLKGGFRLIYESINKFIHNCECSQTYLHLIKNFYDSGKDASNSFSIMQKQTQNKFQTKF